MTATIHAPARSTPVVHDTDGRVVGSGPCCLDIAPSQDVLRRQGGGIH